MILSFPCNFFVCFKFLSDLGRVIGKIKQNELDCRDTAPLRAGLQLYFGAIGAELKMKERRIEDSIHVNQLVC